MADSPAPDRSTLDALLKKGLDLHHSRQLQGARECYQAILASDPRHFDALQLLAATEMERRHFDSALHLLDRALQVNKANPAAFLNHGVTLHELGRFREALESYSQAIRLRPDYPEALNNQGNALKELQQFGEALSSYAQAIRIKPDYAQALFNRANTLKALGRLQEALEGYSDAIRVSPHFADALNNRGNVLRDLKRLDEALASYESTLRINPRHADALSNRGNALKDMRRPGEALASYDAAIRVKPGHTEALVNRGNTLMELRRFEAALASYTAVYEARPDYPDLAGLIQHARMHLCDWRGFEEEVERLKQAIGQGQAVSPPFQLLGLIDDPATQRLCAESWVCANYPEANTSWPRRARARGRRPRIGYFSADFRDHAMLHLMLDVFRHHDKSRFDVYGFSFGPDTGDAWSEQAKGLFRDFIDIRNKPDRDVAAACRDLELDIAIDLMGFTQGSRTGIFSHRAAPVQINFLGYLGSMGAPYMDYILADRVLIPEHERAHYSEQALYLPRHYQPNMAQRTISSKTFSREASGLPSNGVVYCSFNNPTKITPVMFAAWMEILRNVHGSVLWIHVTNETAVLNLQSTAARNGIDPSRLVMAGHLPTDEYLARMRLADLFLDTHPYSGGSTASDAIRVGVPVLTLQGRSFAARMGSSVVSAAGLNKLIAASLPEYIQKAVAMGNNCRALLDCRQQLAASLTRGRLFDPEKYTRDLEEVYVGLLPE